MKFQLLSGMLATALACNSNDASSTSGTRKQPGEALQARADSAYSTLQEIYRQLPDASAGAEGCPDGDIANWSTQESEREVSIIAYQSLRRAVGEPSRESESLTRALTHYALRLPPPEKLDLKNPRTQRRLKVFAERVSYIGVIVPNEERGDAPSTSDGGSRFQGQLVVFRKGQEGPLCHIPFAAGAMGLAQYAERVDETGEEDEQANSILRQNLCRGLEMEISDKLSTISKLLRPAAIDCTSA